MKRVLTAAAIVWVSAFAGPLPVAAQEDAGEPENGFSLMEEGARLLFRGLIQEMEPALDELEGMSGEMRLAMREFAEQMGPAIMELMTLIDEVRHYQGPELLPNGDIIIRRDPDAPPYVPPGPGADEELPEDGAAPGEEIEL